MIKPFEGINRKRIVGVPGLIILTLILLILAQAPNEESEEKLDLIKQLLAFTQQNEYPDCQILDIYIPKLEGQRDNDNIFLEPSHIVRYTNENGREEHIGKGILIDKLNIAKLVEYLVDTPGAGIDCSIGDGTIRGENWIEIQTMLFSKDSLTLNFLTKGNNSSTNSISLFYAGEDGITLDHINLFSENTSFIIKIKDKDSEIVQAVVSEGSNVVEISLNQLLNGDFSSVWGDYKQTQINAVKQYIEEYNDIIKLLEKFGFSEETKELFGNFQKLLK